MAVVNKMELGRELFFTVSQINRQIDVVKSEAKEMNADPLQLRDRQGNWILIPLLAAKAQSLHALAILNQKDY